MRHKLATLIGQNTGLLVEAHRIRANDARSRSRGGIAWDAYGTEPHGKALGKRVFSFDTMSDLLKHGFDATDVKGDIELVAH